MRHNKKTVFVLIFTSTILVSACSFDRRDTIAYETLAEGDLFNKPAYIAAITARFPPGSSVEAFRNYILASGGECHSHMEGGQKLRCEIPYKFKFCAAAIIGINVAFSNNSINGIHVEFGGLGC